MFFVLRKLKSKDQDWKYSIDGRSLNGDLSGGSGRCVVRY